MQLDAWTAIGSVRRMARTYVRRHQMAHPHTLLLVFLRASWATPPVSHYIAAAELFKTSLRVSEQAGLDIARDAAVDGLLQCGVELLQEGLVLQSLDALDAVLAWAPSVQRDKPIGKDARIVVQAMLTKLSALSVWSSLHALGSKAAIEPLARVRFSPLPYWLEWPRIWEEGNGPVIRPRGCSPELVATATDHLEQASSDLDLYLVRGAYVGFHGVILHRKRAKTSSSSSSSSGKLRLLQLPGAPETTAALLTLWAIGLLPGSTKPEMTGDELVGSSSLQGQGPYWLSIDSQEDEDGVAFSVADFAPYRVVARAKDVLGARKLQQRGGFRGATRTELESVSSCESDSSAQRKSITSSPFALIDFNTLQAFLWQSADELRHHERLETANSEHYGKNFDQPTVCADHPNVVGVRKLISLVGGYSLNYYHFITELIPGLLRLKPLVIADRHARLLVPDLPWIKELIVGKLHIPIERLLIDNGCSVYKADVLWCWSINNPLSPPLIDLTRRALLTPQDSAKSSEIACECCTNGKRGQLGQSRGGKGSSSLNTNQMVLLLDRSINCESKSGCVPAPRGRSIGNHAEVLAEIRSATPPNASVCNFVATGFGKCGPMEQLYCFQNAAVVIGVEGAGLTNSVVMQRGASVINLHPAAPTARFSTLVSSCGQSYFWALSEAVGLQYTAYVMPNFTFSGLPTNINDTIAPHELHAFLDSDNVQRAFWL